MPQALNAPQACTLTQLGAARGSTLLNTTHLHYLLSQTCILALRFDPLPGAQRSAHHHRGEQR